ncbi:MAG: XRE family transcriptional regulator [Alphaproteobacteria bacterium]|nr:MAG: XRE family transcriptional regulator [Alphaproteobacteria bacterium]
MGDTILVHQDELTPRQVREGRALLAWSQADLGTATKIATSIIADFERRSQALTADQAAAIRTVLETKGVHLQPDGTVIGPPIRLGGGRSGDGGALLINVTDLAQWAERREAQGNLPELLSKLAVAELGSGPQVHFPAQESVQSKGWDGVTEAPSETGYVPSGTTGWEISTERVNIKGKAQEDYEKRTEDAGHLDRVQSTFVFVTPRSWSDKDTWAQKRRAEGKWRDIRAYDATDLVQWIARHPAVGLWLAVLIGKRPKGTRQLEEVWAEWSLATQPPLSEELILSDRDPEAARVLTWLQGQPAVHAIKSETAEEAAAFVYAAINTLPKDCACHYLMHAVVTHDPDVARLLGDCREPLIIVLLAPDAGLANRMARNGHYGLLAYGDGDDTSGDEITLSRPSSGAIASALEAMGLPRQGAEALARDSARSLAVLRRLIPLAAGRLPAWARSAPSRAFLAAMLAGGWTETREGDRRILERLSGMAYADIDAALTPYTAALDSPLRKVGDAWRVASPRDVWFLLAKHLSTSQLDTFQSVIIDVLGSEDPRFDLAPDKRWMAGVYRIHPEYSGWLRKGLNEVLILLSLFGDRTLAARDGSDRAEQVVRTLLRGATGRRWWSLARSFRLLAEAAPFAFLDMVEAGLSAPDRPIDVLFEVGEDPSVSHANICELLWALEVLAWSPNYFSRVVDLLAQLDAIDPKDNNRVNRPENSLCSLFLLWCPQTYASYDQRMMVLDRLLHRHPEQGWRLLLKLLPKGPGFCVPTPQPRWRDFSEHQATPITRSQIRQGAIAVSDRLMTAAGHSLERWATLVDRLPDLAPDVERAITGLAEAGARGRGEQGIDQLRSELRDFLHRHRSFEDAAWALSPTVLDQIEEIYNNITPEDLIARYYWLFNAYAQLPSPKMQGFEATRTELLEHQKSAVFEIFRVLHFEGLAALAAKADHAGLIGAALHQDTILASEQEEIIKWSLLCAGSKERDIGYGLIRAIFADAGEVWASTLLTRATSENWGNLAIMSILHALPSRRWTWDRAANIGKEIENLYWSEVQLIRIEGGEEDIEFAGRKLLYAGRAHHSIEFLAAHINKSISKDLLVETLKRAVENDHSGSEIHAYSISRIMKCLDKRSDINENTLFELEWRYLNVLRYSERPPVVLMRSLAQDPKTFIDIIKLVYESEDNSEVISEVEDHDQRQKIAKHAYQLLEIWDRVPGSDDAGLIDHAKLFAWVTRARSLAVDARRGRIVDTKIGKVLSSSSIDADGAWPQQAVRDIIEEIRSESMEDGFMVGFHNSIGVTCRGIYDGGRQERDRAAQVRDYYKIIAPKWPRTAALLEKIASRLDSDGRREDERAARNDWQ